MKPLVIKVKFGETLRRFSIHADENGTLDLDDMLALKEKIRGLFKIPPLSDLTLTYIDEDNDFVSLIDDNDLYEAITQDLNPLRIHVSSKSIWTATRRSKFRLSRISSPKESPRFNHPTSPVIDSKVAEEFVKMIEKPMSEAFLRLSHRSTMIAISLALTKLVEGFLNWVDEIYRRSEEKSISDCPTGSNVTEELDTTKASVEPRANIDDPVQENLKQKESYSMSLVPASTSPLVSSNYDDPKDFVACENSNFKEPLSAHSFPDEKEEEEEEWAKKHNDAHLCADFRSSASPDPNLSMQEILLSFQTAEEKPLCDIVNEPCGMTGDGAKISPDRTKQSSRSQADFTFPNVSLNSDHIGMKSCSPLYDSVHPFKRNSFYRNNTGSIFHEGVHWSQSSRTNIPHCCNDGSQYPPKFDSCFIEDVTFPYGTTMSPDVPFTKIWKIRNIGTSAWPVGTRLVWAAGCQFTNQVATEIEIPADGFPVGKEIEISVNLRTPKLHGSYMSFWIMQLPSGERFGQGIPIFIKVDSSLNVAPNAADNGQSIFKNFNSAPLSVLLPEPNASKPAFRISDPEIDCTDTRSKILLDGSRHRFTTGVR